MAAFRDFKLSADHSPSSNSPTASQKSESAPASRTPEVQSNPSVPVSSSSDRIFASPLARKLARESNVTIANVFTALDGKGSGANNRLVSSDVVRALSAIPKGEAASPSVRSESTRLAPSVSSATEPIASGPFSDFEIPEGAKQLAIRLTSSKQQVPHYYVSVELNLSELMKVRDQFNQQLGGGGSKKTKSSELSVLDFLVKAAAMAMKQVPDVNASWMETFVRRYDQADINLVMGSGTLLASPVLRNVTGKGLLSLSNEIQQLESVLFSSDQGEVQNFLQDEEKQAVGTFTIHNLGCYGVKSAAPIVFSPQACALAFGAIQDTVVPRKQLEEGGKEWEVAPVMMATLSCDHRVVDGALSAQYLAAFKQLVEQPMNLLL